MRQNSSPVFLFFFAVVKENVLPESFFFCLFLYDVCVMHDIFAGENFLFAVKIKFHLLAELQNL